MTLRSVVLPAPFGPMIATISPRRTSRLTWLSACTAPKRTLMPSTSRRGGPPDVRAAEAAGASARRGARNVPAPGSPLIRLPSRRGRGSDGTRPVSSRRRPAREHLRLPDPHVRPYGARPPVLVGDLRLDRDVVLVRVERIHQRGVLLGDEPPTDLACPGDLLVVGVQLLVKHQEAADLGAAKLRLVEEAPVHPRHLLADELVDLGLLGQVRVARVGEAAPLGPAPDRRDVDVEERGHVGAVLSDADRLTDVGRELELVLQVLRREQRAVSEPTHVAGPVDDAEMPVLVDDPRVTGMDPAVFLRLLGGLRVLVVGHEHA